MPYHAYYNGMHTNHYIRGFDMKKRVMIYVDSDDWTNVRLKCITLGLSAGDYLIGLHKGSGTVINPKMEIKEIFIHGDAVEIKSGEMKLDYVEEEAGRLKELAKVSEGITERREPFFNPRPKGQDGKK